MKVFKTHFDVFKILKEEFSDYRLLTEIIDVKEAIGRICANDVIAKIDVPHFDKSTVDGYALRCEETFSANDENPAVFEIIGEVKTGHVPLFEIDQNKAAKIYTGSAVPRGADAIAMLENCIEDKNRLLVFKPVKPSENILKKGEDIKSGLCVIKKYQRLKAAQVGVLCAIGEKKVEVFKKLNVAIISTGDEIISQDDELSGAKIYDVNSYTLYSSLKEEYAIPKLYGIVGDDYERLVNILSLALKENDIVLISGGSSVGTYDNTLRAIKNFDGAVVLVDGVAIKPGKPTIIAKVLNKAVIGLPGHPVSCLFIFEFFVKRLIDIMTHQNDTSNKVWAKMRSGYSISSGRTEFVFVRLIYTDQVLAEPLHGKSGSINLLNNAAGYIRVDATKTGLKEGDMVEVTLI